MTLNVSAIAARIMNGTEHHSQLFVRGTIINHRHSASDLPVSEVVVDLLSSHTQGPGPHATEAWLHLHYRNSLVNPRTYPITINFCFGDPGNASIGKLVSEFVQHTTSNYHEWNPAKRLPPNFFSAVDSLSDLTPEPRILCPSEYKLLVFAMSGVYHFIDSQRYTRHACVSEYNERMAQMYPMVLHRLTSVLMKIL